ncbi:MAG TPA: four helix bundle protein [Terriglobales bacterium]|nr:four helix bundle protein [Terriglobales bacterium]
MWEKAEIAVTNTFRDLIAWQKAKTLARDIYLATRSFPTEEQYALRDQLRKAVISVSSNIAEGKGRATQRDFCHFLVQARGSLYEVESELEIARDLHYITDTEADQLVASCNEVARVLNGLINSTKTAA